MFRAIGRWFRALGLLMTGQIDSARRELDANPNVVRARYEDIIRDKTTRIHQYKQAVAQLIAQEQQKAARIKELSEEVERLERLKAGALAKAKQTTSALKAQGKSAEEIKASEDYQRCLAAYNDFSSTLEEKTARIAELEDDVAGYRKTIGEHKVQLQSLLREIEKLKAETNEAVADMITATQEREIADALSGIAEDGTAEELQRLRQMRHEAKAEATVSRELSGTDVAAQEAEFLEYASRTQASTEFDALLGLEEEPVAAPPAAPVREAEGGGGAPPPPSGLPE